MLGKISLWHYVFWNYFTKNANRYFGEVSKENVNNKTTTKGSKKTCWER